LVREGLEGLFQKYAPILEASFTPEVILEAARENLDTYTLSELYLELRALPWQEFEPTRQKFETIFADRVIEIIREELPRTSPSAGRIRERFSWNGVRRLAKQPRRF
jgi:hypothetical protein